MYEQPIKTIAQRLQELFDYTGDTQIDLSKKTGISRSDVSRYASGARVPRQDKIGIISVTYNIDPAWLMGYDVPMRKKLSTEQAQEDFELLDKWHKLNDMQKTLIMLTIKNLLGEV